MKFFRKIVSSSLILLSLSSFAQQRQWTLQQCLDYARDNNIQLKQKAIASKSSHEDVLQSRAALFPSVSFSTSQNMNYRPFSPETTMLEGGTMTTSSNAISYNGSYGINARWTVWNGGKNRMDIQQSEITERGNEYAEQEQFNSIQEQITRLYVQILYEAEAIKVNEEVLKASQMQADRAKVMVQVGTLARVDLVQLESQVAQDQLSLVTAQSQLENYKLQLKQLLEIHDNEAFDVMMPEVGDDKVLSLIPDKESVYAGALGSRPEIKIQQLNIENSKIALKSARTAYMPTVSLSGSLGTSNASGQSLAFGEQIKNSLSYTLGATVSVPIYDNHSTRTSIRKAKYSQETAELQLQESEKSLYSTIESYYLDATTNQQKYIYAKKNVESMQESYSLVSEQFALGLKNIVELTTGKNNLLQAEQQQLETKYTTLYNMAMLKFYQGEPINL
ncbi:MAG: TolC family protein [Prevotellaceae bacterium]|nr:TolC family protein [Prevotellaceae bacterium]